MLAKLDLFLLNYTTPDGVTTSRAVQGSNKAPEL